MLLGMLYGFLASLAMIAPIFIFGYLIAKLNRFFYKLAGRGSRAVCYITGVIGTPIHELSHASMCLLFGHKIKEMKLFQIDSADGTLGYVRHSYNKKNLYHRIGNFFIGIAPIVVGSLFLVTLMMFMVNAMFLQFAEKASVIGNSISGNTTGQDAFVAVFSMFRIYFIHAANGWWWGYLALSAAIALHMNLSKADISGSKEGIIFVILLLLVCCIILGLIGQSVILTATVWFLYLTLMLSLILLQSLFLSGLWVAAAFLIRLPSMIRTAVRRRNTEKTMQRTREYGQSKEAQQGKKR